MTLIQSDFHQTKSYSAAEVRYSAFQPVMQEGVLGPSDYAVTQRGAGANMSVDVAAGAAFVQGDSAARQGLYFVANDAIVNVPIAANASGNPRIDQIVLRINDTVYSGGSDLPTIEVQTGTPNASASLATRLGAVSPLPASMLKLADVEVVNGAASIVATKIGNLRDPRAGAAGYPAVTATLSLAGAPPQFAMGRPIGYVPHCSLHNSAAFSVPNNTATAQNCYDLEDMDPDGMHAAGTNPRITVVTPGTYRITVTNAYEATGHSTFLNWFVINAAGASGANRVGGSPNTTGAFSANSPLSISDTIRLGFGDYVEAGIYQSSGGAINLIATNSHFNGGNHFSAEWIAP